MDVVRNFSGLVLVGTLVKTEGGRQQPAANAGPSRSSVTRKRDRDEAACREPRDRPVARPTVPAVRWNMGQASRPNGEEGKTRGHGRRCAYVFLGLPRQTGHSRPERREPRGRRTRGPLLRLSFCVPSASSRSAPRRGDRTRAPDHRRGFRSRACLPPRARKEVEGQT